MKIKIHDIFVGYVSWSGGGKHRPVLIFGRSKSKATVYNITTKYENKSEEIRSKYFRINDWKQAGLNQQSYIDTVEAVNLPISSIDTENFIGRLTKNDAKELIKFLSENEENEE